MLRFARVLPIALIAVVASCADSREVIAPRTTDAEPVRFHQDAPDYDDPFTPFVSEIAQYLPGEVPRGPAVAWKWIGAEGGSLRLDDFEIVVPAGALDAPRRFEIRQMPIVAARRHAAVWFSPHGAQFKLPVTIRLPLDATTSAGDPETPILWWDRNEWVPLDTHPTQDGRIEAQTSHFSLYATSARRGFTTVGG